jgi:hypothetical protein
VKPTNQVSNAARALEFPRTQSKLKGVFLVLTNWAEAHRQLSQSVEGPVPGTKVATQATALSGAADDGRTEGVAGPASSDVARRSASTMRGAARPSP